MKSLVSTLSLVTFLLAAPSLWAKPDDPDVGDARRHYQRGLAHYNLQEYPLAIEEFEAAYRTYPDPVFLYNLGQSHRLSGNNERALYFYRVYLRSALKIANRKEVERHIERLENVVAAQHQAINTPPTSTIPPVGSKPAVEPPPAPPPALREPPPKPVVVVAPRPAPATVEMVTRREPASEKPAYKKWWVWTLVGVAAAGAAVGLGVGLTVGQSTRNTYPPVSF